MTEQVNQEHWPSDTDFSEIPVNLLNISNRSLNVFRRQGIRTVQDILDMEEKDLTDMRQFGPGCLAETIKALAEHGLKLKAPDYRARR